MNDKKQKFLVGIDEAGRGPLAGPVAVAAVIFFSHSGLKYLKGIKDSKQSTPQKRELWFKKACMLQNKGVLDFTVSFSSEKIIDTKGIMFGIRISLSRSLRSICEDPHTARIFLDGGLKAPSKYPYQKTIIRGDETEPIIALASILAKVTRDKRMTRYARVFPRYGFDQHKGYGTRAHYKAIRKHGICAIHRMSFLNKHLHDSKI